MYNDVNYLQESEFSSLGNGAVELGKLNHASQDKHCPATSLHTNKYYNRNKTANFYLSHE